MRTRLLLTAMPVLPLILMAAGVPRVYIFTAIWIPVGLWTTLEGRD
jgi:hypothetical protein